MTMSYLPPLDSDEDSGLPEREVVRIAEFTLVPAEPHPFYRVLSDDGSELPKALQGAFTSRAEAIRRVKEHVDGRQKQ